jgi:phage portal protein BeeE
MSSDIRVSEWDGTPWAGEARLIEPTKALDIIRPPTIKAVTDVSPWRGIPLTSLYDTPQRRAAAALRAYKVGWFYKAEHKIAEDIANLKVSVAPEDTEGDNEKEVIEPDLFTPWERLDPIGQFLRLMERPNEKQTGRALRAKTQIRLDMAGTAFWYLENGASGLPTAIYGISPSRMWPSFDNQGVLIGWVMDRDSPGKAVPFEADEILLFATSSADDDPFGTGILEAVYGELPLSELMARHVSDLLTTGGRLAGMLSPKDRALSEDEFQDAQRAWRSVASDPNAARRLLLFPEPMEYTAGSSTPAEIGIPELANLNRDNILTAFPISPYMLGVPIPGGLNASGEVRREEKLSYQEGTIHPRVEMFEEIIQVGLLARYEAIMGRTYDFEVAEPNLDTAPALIEKVGALRALIDAGFDDKDSVAAVGLDHIKYNGPPAPPALPAAPEGSGLTVTATDTNRRDPAGVQQQVVKAEIEDQRDALTRNAIGRGTSLMSEFFRVQLDRVAERIRATMPKTKADRKANPTDWWDPDAEDAELRTALQGFYVEVGRDGLQAVANNLGKFVGKREVRAVVEDLLAYGGERIADINAKTLQSLTLTLAEGTRRGYSLNQLIEGVPDESFVGVKGTLLDNGTPVFSDLRAETIARTETMLSYNRSAVTGYRAFGVEQLQAYDGDGDAECASRAGEIFSVDEALSIEDHPNGTLVWSPVIGDKADDKADDDERLMTLAIKALDALSQKPEIHVHNAVSPADVHVEMAPTTIPVNVAAAEVNIPPTVVNLPEQPAPIINIEAPRAPDVHVDAPVINLPEITVEAARTPDVHIEPAVVNIASPSVTVEPPQVTVEAPPAPEVRVDVHVPEPRRTTKTIKRDKHGAITHIEES